MTIDDQLVKAVDKISKRLHTSRSSFTRKALREALSRYNLEQLELKHQQGYMRHTISTDEFLVWETEQAWGDE